MRKLLALLTAFASPALAQTPAGVINAPIYATGYISQVGGTNVTTNIPPQPNHPTNLNIYTTGAISGTWTIKLPNPAFEGQMLSFNCGAAVNAISVTSSDGSSIDSTLPTACGINSGFTVQFDQRSNIWRNLGSSNTATFKPFTGVASQWPWQLNADGTWTFKQPAFSDLTFPVPSSVGASTYPVYRNSVATTVTATSGSATVTVANGASVSNGDLVVDDNVTPFVCQNYNTCGDGTATYVVSGGGTNTLVLSHSASATVSGRAIKFGQDRWDTTSALTATSFAAKTGFFGAQALGNSGWVSRYFPANAYPLVAPLIVSSVPTGGGALLSAARTSDAAGGGFAAALADTALAVADSTASNYPVWARYTQLMAMPGTHGYAFGEENSLYNKWTSPNLDPYDVNALDGTRNLRLDCGISHLISSNKCSAAMDILPNGASYYKGIVVGDGALDTASAGFGEVISMPKQSGFSWFSGAGDRAWSLYFTGTTASGGSLVLQDDSLAVYGSGSAATTSFFYVGNSGAGVAAVGPATGNQVSLFGSATGAVAVYAAGTETNINLALGGKGSGTVSTVSKLQTTGATTSSAGLNIYPGTAPTSPSNGDVWTTTTGFFARINGATQQFANLNGPNTFTGTTTMSEELSLSAANATGLQNIKMQTLGVTDWSIGEAAVATNDLYVTRFIAGAYQGAAIYLQNSTGYIGINQGAASYPLDVSGTANATAYRVGGTAGVTCNSGLSGTSRTINGIVTTC